MIISTISREDALKIARGFYSGDCTYHRIVYSGGLENAEKAINKYFDELELNQTDQKVLASIFNTLSEQIIFRAQIFLKKYESIATVGDKYYNGRVRSRVIVWETRNGATLTLEDRRFTYRQASKPTVISLQLEV